MAKRNFGKDYKTPRELVTLLENRGLIINDRQKAQLYLEHWLLSIVCVYASFVEDSKDSSSV